MKRDRSKGGGGDIYPLLIQGGNVLGAPERLTFREDGADDFEVWDFLEFASRFDLPRTLDLDTT